MVDIIVIGAGPAGLTSAIYAMRAGLSVTVFEKSIYGGQVASTSEVENYPAVQKISGIEFSTNIYNQAVDQGVDIQFDEVERISLEGKVKIVKTASGEHKAKAVILANGVERRKLGCVGEKEFTGRGVSYCATCDGAFFKNKEVAIVGGGNTALEDALFLANNCTKVYLIHRRDDFRGEEVLEKSVKARKNIEILYSHGVEKIEGEKTVSRIEVKDLKTEEKRTIDVSGIFIAIGLKPNNKMFENVLELDEGGYIVSDESCTTSVEGVYVAGDNRTKFLRQIITAASDGAIAAVQAANYINVE
ncbi:MULTISPECIES: thioredoxin-disulfide reductase [unclassified Clostridioides]|uniref:thioredoxin-disulfide reductase n=1 Tax=unclassified Clostridioides TaxID=2635829 RepID=UPI001D0C1324|nr:thioredoxin-disulfide reductase [Clostridioides sp. ES-S-0049-03]MCC0652391.1 thioredoxin-disulfide reductase [Clostridioides sp. ES-S-0001-03]MCC0655062.1 thioredoxin-disulfide reductase [Clostridioides sp. ES-S-0123-01]MCC0673513.1 thioredoxin-disulfide reductase [Clostridioides sp. ES-S-0145-01]MCC0675161.1 thioredoxin-disulfide reductase [Clostridioides sp. ES-W-0018-02]MCC0679773.1 thioredoxin-disulfide reductase [Clostridioides sp. ES-S-0005-03]MCC0702134.1 thioredoxin-disulfide redu